MTPPVRLAMLLLPGDGEPALRVRLRDLAARSNWQLREPWGAELPPLSPDIDALILCESIENAASFDPTDMAVAFWGPEAAIQGAMTQFGLERFEAERHAAHRLAQASEWLRNGAWRLTPAEPLEVPGLGCLALDEALPSSPHDNPTPLGIFDILPPPIGARALWGVDLFEYPRGEEPGAVIDLTGAGRLLMHGPYLALPPGRWRIGLRIAYRSDKGGVPLRLEWGSGGDVEQRDFRISAPGVYEVDLAKTWAQTDTAQLRLWLYHAVFDGQIEILKCWVDMVDDAAGSLQRVAAPGGVELASL